MQRLPQMDNNMQLKLQQTAILVLLMKSNIGSCSAPSELPTALQQACDPTQSDRPGGPIYGPERRSKHRLATYDCGQKQWSGDRGREDGRPANQKTSSDSAKEVVDACEYPVLGCTPIFGRQIKTGSELLQLSLCKTSEKLKQLLVDSAFLL
jgi:hypothetical protein